MKLLLFVTISEVSFNSYLILVMKVSLNIFDTVEVNNKSPFKWQKRIRYSWQNRKNDSLDLSVETELRTNQYVSRVLIRAHYTLV